MKPMVKRAPASGPHWRSGPEDRECVETKAASLYISVQSIWLKWAHHSTEALVFLCLNSHPFVLFQILRKEFSLLWPLGPIHLLISHSDVTGELLRKSSPWGFEYRIALPLNDFFLLKGRQAIHLLSRLLGYRGLKITGPVSLHT